MDFWDIVLIIIYFPLCLFIGKRIKNKHRNNPLYKKWFMKGLAIKLFGAIAFCLVYTYYFDYGGDTRGYYHDTKVVVSSLQEGFSVFWNVFNRQYSNIESATLNYLYQLTYRFSTEYYTVNTGVPFYIFGFGNFFSMSLLIALFSYWGVWNLFLLFYKYYPRMEKQMAFAVLFVPSVWFWGSGFSKDTLMLCFIGLFLFHVDKLFGGKVFNLKSILIILVCAYLMLVIKAYIIVSLVPAVLLWRTLYIRDKIKIAWLRALVLPILVVVGIVVIAFAFSFFSKYNQKYSLDNFVDSAQVVQNWHYQEGRSDHGRGSSYTLGEYSDTDLGLIKIFPSAVNVTLFRPYLWEVKNPGMLAQALESLLFLCFTIWIVLKAGIVKTYRYISNDSFLLMCVVFSIFFAFAIGFSSYNFGALSRYKIQCLPFYIGALFIVHQKAVAAKRKSRFMHQLAKAEAKAKNKLVGTIQI